jgi:hypothetical protein
VGRLVRDLTFVCAYFENPGMLQEQQRVWAAYPAKLQRHLHVIVVDDASPQAPARNVFTPCGLASQRLYRAGVHRRWDWLFCRNLGADQATTEWLLLTDIDHVLPAETLQRLLSGPLDPRLAYRFARVDAPRRWPYALAECTPYKRHNDSWLLTRALFHDDRVGGYDERLSGCYGSSSDFTGRLVTATKDLLLKEPLIRYPREILPDASTSPLVYTRKGDAENDRDLSQRKIDRAQDKRWRPRRLTIPWALEVSC